MSAWCCCENNRTDYKSYFLMTTIQTLHLFGETTFSAIRRKASSGPVSQGWSTECDDAVKRVNYPDPSPLIICHAHHAIPASAPRDVPII